MNTEIPFALQNPQEMETGQEASRIIEFGPEDERKILKIIRPEKLRLADAKKEALTAIQNKMERALALVSEKSKEWAELRSVFGPAIVSTSYLLFGSESQVHVGVVQDKVDGMPLTQSRDGTYDPKVVRALQEFLDLLRKAQENHNIAETVAVKGHIPTAEELLDYYYEAPDWIPELTNPLNLIYLEDEDRVVAVDW